ncbi:MAG: DUF3179 domain-containing protein [Pseudomonadota bacterium]
MRILFAAILTLLPTLALATDFAGQVPDRWKSAWPQTDFTKITVDPTEIFSGGPPKDGIPAITNPEMIPARTETRLGPREPVMSIEIDGMPPRAYPIRYLMWHEIVNDRIRDRPIAVTFCPLCNSGLIFDLRLPTGVEGHMELELGVSGMLRHSDMVMYDRQTESWWQQFTGEAIAGQLTGAELVALPALLESWDSFRTRVPNGEVMDQPRDFDRPYGQNPYQNYDTGTPFLYRGDGPPEGIHPLLRVVRVGDRGWPLPRLREAGRIEEDGVRLTWTEGQASALSTVEIASGTEVGNVMVTDLAGKLLVHEVVFAFAFHEFTDDAKWMMGQQ